MGSWKSKDWLKLAGGAGLAATAYQSYNNTGGLFDFNNNKQSLEQFTNSNPTLDKGELTNNFNNYNKTFDAANVIGTGTAPGTGMYAPMSEGDGMKYQALAGIVSAKINTDASGNIADDSLAHQKRRDGVVDRNAAASTAARTEASTGFADAFTTANKKKKKVGLPVMATGL